MGKARLRNTGLDIGDGLQGWTIQLESSSDDQSQSQSIYHENHQQAPVRIASLFGPSTGNIKILLKPDFESLMVWLQEGVR